VIRANGEALEGAAAWIIALTLAACGTDAAAVGQSDASTFDATADVLVADAATDHSQLGVDVSVDSTTQPMMDAASEAVADGSADRTAPPVADASSDGAVGDGSNGAVGDGSDGAVGDGSDAAADGSADGTASPLADSASDQESEGSNSSDSCAPTGIPSYEDITCDAGPPGSAGCVGGNVLGCQVNNGVCSGCKTADGGCEGVPVYPAGCVAYQPIVMSSCAGCGCGPLVCICSGSGQNDWSWICPN
jgi:hypothetical protein